MNAKLARRGWKYALFALWILEWVLAWSMYLGPLEGTVGFLWIVGLFYFVFASRSGRMPRWLHTWGWMAAILVVTVLRAWVIGDVGVLMFSAILAKAWAIEPGALHLSSLPPQFAVLDAFASSMLLGFVIGFAGLCEACLVAAASWLGDFFRERREASRVPFLPRGAVVILQAPIFFSLLGVGLCAVAGSVGVWAHPSSVPVGGGETYAGPAAAIVAIVAIGLLAWCLAVVHLGRLSALAGGGRLTRVLLGLYGVAAAIALVAATQSVVGLIAGIVWLWLQLAALRRARPRAAA